MAERKVAWKARKDNSLIGSDITRIDGVEKASGHAKYAADINTAGTLFARLLTFKGGAAVVGRPKCSHRMPSIPQEVTAKSSWVEMMNPISTRLRRLPLVKASQRKAG